MLREDNTLVVTYLHVTHFGDNHKDWDWVKGGNRDLL